MPELVIMVGLPGSGKTVYRRKHYAGYICLSHDDYVEAYAEKNGMSYSEAYPHVNSWRDNQDALTTAIAARQNIVADFVCATVKSRAAFINAVKDHGYTITCIHFSLTDVERQRRYDARAAETGKVIDAEAIKGMMNKFVAPTKDEGFDRIVVVRD